MRTAPEDMLLLQLAVEQLESAAEAKRKGETDRMRKRLSDLQTMIAPYDSIKIQNQTDCSLILHSLTTLLRDIRGVTTTTAETENSFDFFGSTQLKELIYRALTPNLDHKVYHGLRQPPKRILLYGPPGNGKTSLVHHAAQYVGRELITITGSSLLSKYYGESERNLVETFNKAKEKDAVVFCDEIDLLGLRRGSSEHGAPRGVLTELLQLLDDLEKPSTNVVFIGATNTPSDLDAALLRRFDAELLLANPDYDTRLEYLTHLFQPHLEELDEDVDLMKICQGMEEYSFADMKRFAKLVAQVGTFEERNTITTEHFEVVMETFTPAVGDRKSYLE